MLLICPIIIHTVNIIYFIGTYINGAYGENTKNYTQEEINNAWKKMFSKYTSWNLVDNKYGCWPRSIVPYTMDTSFTKAQVEHIINHMYQIQNRTCVRWVETALDRIEGKYVEFFHNTNHSNKCFMEEDVREGTRTTKTLWISRINLGDECFGKEAVIHEMLHSLGFIHEQSRIDRDCYVAVNEGSAHKRDLGIIYDDLTFERWPYDKRSVMHYVRDPGDSLFDTSYIIKDKAEPFKGRIWKHRLGTAYGFWGRTGHRTGKLTYLDVFKINYRFCGAPDFCETQSEMCDRIEEEEQLAGCKKLYKDIADGRAKPN